MLKLKLLSIIFLFYAFANAQWIVQQAPTTGGIKDIYFADTSKGWITALNDGILYTSDGGFTWAQQYAGYAVNISGLSDTELWVTGKKDTLLHTTNGGLSWEKIPLNSFLDLDSVATLTGIYFCNSNTGWLYAFGRKFGAEAACLIKTTDSGINWQVKINPITSVAALIQFLDISYGFIAGTDPVPLCKTTDGGESWDTLAYLGFWSGLMDMQFINPNIGWATSDGPVLTTAVWKTTNGGVNWENNLLFQCSDLSTYIFFTDTLNGWVVQWTCLSAATEIYHTINAGLSWDLQFTYPPFSPQKIFFTDSLHGWVISRYTGAILHTSTGGVIPVELISFSAEVIKDEVRLEWKTATETNNRGFEIQKSKVKDQKSNWAKIGFVAGHGTTTEPKSYSFIDNNIITGYYKYRLKQIDYDGTFTYSNEIEVEVDFTPEEYVLYQNYPNPFNPTTKIKFEIPNVEATRRVVFTTLKVYDILGNEVATLVNEEKQPGVYEVELSAKSGSASGGNVGNLSSGVYFYSITAGDFHQARKMLLLR